MGKRGRPPAFDREEVLHRAMEVFWARGFAGASLADLCAAMGLRPPSLYAAFGSKEGLFREVVDEYARTIGDGIWNCLDDASTAREAVANVLRRSVEAFTKDAVSRGCMIVLAAPEYESSHSQVCEELSRRRAASTNRLKHRLERAVREGELPQGTSCAQLSAYYAAVQHGLSVLARDGATRDTLMQVVDAAMAGWDGAVNSAVRHGLDPTARTDEAVAKEHSEGSRINSRARNRGQP